MEQKRHSSTTLRWARTKSCSCMQSVEISAIASVFIVAGLRLWQDSQASCGWSEIEPSLTLAIILFQVWIVCEQLQCRNYYHFVVECDTFSESLLVYKLHSPPYTSAFLPHTIPLLNFHERINDSFNSSQDMSNKINSLYFIQSHRYYSEVFLSL